MPAVIADLDAAITSLSASVDALAARIVPATPVDVQSQVDAVKAIQVKVDALAPKA